MADLAATGNRDGTGPYHRPVSVELDLDAAGGI